MNQNLKSKILAFIGVLIFSCGYLLLNYNQILYKVYYRYAGAHDIYNAVINFSGFLFQGILLLTACVLLQKRLLMTMLTVISLSALVDLSYEQILGGNLNPEAMSWMITESRQMTTAMMEFSFAFCIAISRVVFMIFLLIFSRKILRVSLKFSTIPVKLVTKRAALISALAMMILPGEILRAANLPQGNETNAYSMALYALVSVYPQRAVLDDKLLIGPNHAEKIIWLVDESVSARGVALALSASVLVHGPIDFGEVASMANCSAPSNAALRWGVDVQHVNPRSDLRTTPSIWAYAKRAGYRTTLIDGQVSGVPQNMIWKPERILIDDFSPAQSGIDTDLMIAEKLNVVLKQSGLDFIYVVLRGAHYAYEGNYPKGSMPDNSSLLEKYLEAIRYSKLGFFDKMFLGVDRSRVAVIYTSDHGQHLEINKLPHCSLTPSADEFSVPLLLFLPKQTMSDLGIGSVASYLEGRSHSQIFPTSLWLMGYDSKFAEANYDSLLNKPTNRYVWFGRSFTPSSDTGTIEIHTSSNFPLR